MAKSSKIKLFKFKKHTKNLKNKKFSKHKMNLISHKATNNRCTQKNTPNPNANRCERASRPATKF